MSEEQKLSPETVRQIAERQVQYVNLPLMITWVPWGTPCIDVRTHEMRLPLSLCEAPLAAIKSTIGHELAHPLVFPQTSHWATYYTMLAERLGYADAHGFCNVIADLFVNHWNLMRPPWKQAFRTWVRTFYTVTSTTSDPRFEFLALMMQSIVDELDGRAVSFNGRIDRDAFELLFHDPRSLRPRYEELAELLRGRLAGSPLKEGQKVSIPGPGELRDLDPAADAEEFQEWMEAIRGLGAGAGFEHIKKQHDRSACLFDVAELLAFQEFMVTEEEDSRAAQKPSGPEELAAWSPSDSPQDLRVGDSLRQFGVLIPGVTTLKRIDGVERTEEKQGRGTLFLVIDTSGSMHHCLAGILVLGWAAALGARKRHDRVAALEFSAKASYLLEPSFE